MNESIKLYKKTNNEKHTRIGHGDLVGFIWVKPNFAFPTPENTG